MKGLAAALALTIACGATGAMAHPHAFVSTGIEVVFAPDGRATGLRITWVYDEFLSMIILEERGMDKDADGQLTEAEKAQITGFDMNWDADFEGDTYALLGEVPLALGRPQDWTADYDGYALRSTHLRRFAEPVEVTDQPLIVQSYDPGFYTEYTIDLETGFSGRDDCAGPIYEPDRAKADAILAQAMEEYSGADIETAGFPAVGAAYADEVRVTCAARP